MIETARLILRPFRDADRDAFAALNGDPRVSDWLGGPIDRRASDAALDRVTSHIAEHGFGFWAAERKADARLIGMIGLMRLQADLPPSPAVEIGWRLSPDAWGQGFASEGGAAALAWGFEHLDIDEIIAITAVDNRRSQRVMQRIGMVEQPGRAFDHPHLPVDHPLRRHVLYAAGRACA
ncbi:MAG TPA: GNAT family N-acetyltransferase [Phenylobacterium sp.]|uniref:GNAT family N-acetyltransferase n=1 Tax=Phenylobacterium sp. TaxID=1871053 RepID=UPI002B48E2B9|nr:GNAT family N-acetyltransferase [Phenylobacterium sp.]HKR89253.1 GNAT family N-acetyltransferase [Phenylobacterium sp.]